MIVDDGVVLICRIARGSDGMACRAIPRSHMPTQHRADTQQHLRNHYDRAAHILPNRPDSYGWI